jgi:meso-butanediol dehydrogenase / (S,S)-butanediol dehydrogenase / diacetyl reductase
MPDRLDGQVALVTGGAKGIGRTISGCLADEGAQVMMVGRDEAAGHEAVDQILSRGGTARFLRSDVSREEDVRRAVDGTIDAFGALTVLINNAAAIDQGALDGAVTDIELDAWNRLLNVNLTSSFLFSKYSIPHMKKVGKGSIISLSSLAGVVGLQGITAYATAKGGIGAMMRSIATDYGKDNIRANTIVLGMVAHGVISFIAEEPFLGPNLAAHNTPYLGRPEDAGYACVYLASDESRFVTGSEMRVDGGASRYPAATVAGAWERTGPQPAIPSTKAGK